MSALLLNRLNEKIIKAVGEISHLRKERERLLAEIDLMRDENRRARRTSGEYRALVDERNKMIMKLERLLGKLEKLKV